MSDKCHCCPDVKYRQCPSPMTLLNGELYCERSREYNSSAVCSQCGEHLVIGHFAYEPNWREFWCEDCLKELLESAD